MVLTQIGIITKAWQQALHELSLHHVVLTKKNTLLAIAKQVFEFGDKNGKLLVWLNKGQYAVTHIGRIACVT